MASGGKQKKPPVPQAPFGQTPGISKGHQNPASKASPHGSRIPSSKKDARSGATKNGKPNPINQGEKSSTRFAHAGLKGGGQTGGFEAAEQAADKVLKKKDTAAQHTMDKIGDKLKYLGPKGQVAGLIVKNSLPLIRVFAVIIAIQLLLALIILAALSGATSEALQAAPKEINAVGVAGSIAGINEKDRDALAAGLGHIPPMALDGYIRAAAFTELRTLPNEKGCRMRWQMLGAIGNFESGHGTNQTNAAPFFKANGDTINTITQNGGGPGRGVFQFEVDTWAGFQPLYDMDFGGNPPASDGSPVGDGVEDANNVYDEGLMAGLYLCRSKPKDFSTATSATEADMDDAYWGYCGGRDICTQDMTTRTKWALQHDQYTVCVVPTLDSPTTSCGTNRACADEIADANGLPACYVRVTKATAGLTFIGNHTCPIAGDPSHGNGPEFGDSYGESRAGGARQHMGVDMNGVLGTPIVANVSGLVMIQTGGAGGNAYHLQGDDGVFYYGGHLDTFADIDGNGVAGDEPHNTFYRIELGQQIGTLGYTGASASNPHLHFEVLPGGIKINGEFPGPGINPTPYVDQLCWNSGRAPLGLNTAVIS